MVKLMPCREESVSWDSARHTFIEGDNRVVLPLLAKTYFGKIGWLYADPPYNVKVKDKGYLDSRAWREWEEGLTEQFAAAKPLLAPGGLVAVSIGEEGMLGVGNVLERVFGRQNRISLITIRTRSGGMGRRGVTGICEYLWLFSNDAKRCEIQKEPRPPRLQKTKMEDLIKKGVGARKEDYPNLHYPLYVNTETGEVAVPPEDGVWREVAQSGAKGARKEDYPSLNFPLYIQPETGEVAVEAPGSFRELAQTGGKGSRKEDRPNLHYPLYVEETTGEVSTEEVSHWIEVYPQTAAGEDGRWIWSRKTVQERIHLVRGVLRKTGVWTVKFWDEKGPTKEVVNLWTDGTGFYQNSANYLRKLFGKEVFRYSKPVDLMKRIIRLSPPTGLFMDMFAGSCSTGEAVLECNREDGGRRAFLMIQRSEPLQHGLGFDTVAELGKERLRRVLKDGEGFRVYRLVSIK